MPSFPDTLKSMLAQFAVQAPQSVADSITATINPTLYQQQQENLRAKAQLAQQLQLHNSISPYEQAQLQQAQQAHTDALRQQQFENNRQTGHDVWQALTAGAMHTPAGATPDFTVGGQGFTLPQRHAISASSPVGQSLGLTEDLTGLSTDEYAKYVLPQLEKLSVAQDKKSQLEANGRALDAQLPSNVSLIHQRFSPAYYQPLGQADPMSQALASNFETRLRDASESDRKAGNQKATTEVMKELSTYKSPWEQSREAQLQRQLEINARASANAQTAADRSYTFHEKELDTLAKPIYTMGERLSRLQATVAQGTPQADALIAPELLSIVAGVNRMSEPELQRIVGGRSAWQGLQAAAQKWSLDPSTANSITPTQRGQIRSLMSAVQQRVDKQQAVLNQGYADLAGSQDPLEHRRIYDRVRKGVTGVDATQGTQGSTGSTVDDLVQKYGGGR